MAKKRVKTSPKGSKTKRTFNKSPRALQSKHDKKNVSNKYQELSFSKGGSLI